MDYSYGVHVLFPSLLSMIFFSRIYLYVQFYFRHAEVADSGRFTKIVGLCELILDISTIALNIVAVHYGHNVTVVEGILYKINLYTIPPAILTFIWCCTLIRPGEYEQIDGEVQEELVDEEYIPLV